METAQEREKEITISRVKSALVEEEESWDLVVEPRSSLFSFNLAEVWRYRDLLFLFIKRDFTAQYKQTVLGPLWHFIQPLLTTVVFLVLFNKLANFPTDGIEPILFYLSGITIWNYFSSCFIATSNTFVANASIFGKVYFPRLIIPLSTVMSQLVKFGIQFSLLLCAMIYYTAQGKSFHVGWGLLLIPIILVLMAGLGLGMGIIFSSLTTKYRDFQVLIGFAVQLLMYTTPIVYPLSFLKSKSYAAWIEWNPLAPIIEAFRYAIFGSGTIDGLSILYAGLVVLVVIFTGLLFFNRVEKTFMDTV